VEDPPAGADANTADHRKIIAVRGVAYRFSKQYPWAQALFDFDGMRPAVVVPTLEASGVKMSSGLASSTGRPDL
jgi:hypothetical protein